MWGGYTYDIILMSFLLHHFPFFAPPPHPPTRFTVCFYRRLWGGDEKWEKNERQMKKQIKWGIVESFKNCMYVLIKRKSEEKYIFCENIIFPLVGYFEVPKKKIHSSLPFSAFLMFYLFFSFFISFIFFIIFHALFSVLGGETERWTKREIVAFILLIFWWQE